MRGRLAIATGALLGLAMLAPDARAATYAIAMRDAYFSPGTSSGVQGSTFRWTNRGAITHTTTQYRAVVPGWNKSLSPGQSWSKTIPYAGTYLYYCIPHSGDGTSGMRGTVKVPARATPSTGSTSTSFTVRVSTVTAPSGWVYDVQRRKNSGSWVSFRTGTRAPAVAFRAGSLGAGTYYFRARLRRVSTGNASSWSPAARVGVTA